MKVTALVENQSNGTLKSVHGLSLYIETPRHKILFDLGPDNTLFENSRALGIDLAAVDTVILSHGHRDHGGALARFLAINHTAKIYAQKKAFEKHYTKFLFLKIGIGIDAALMNHPQIVLLDGDFTVDEELRLFTVADTAKCYSSANSSLYAGSSRDDFSHEQNLLILGGTYALIMGCGHAGVVNIIEAAAPYRPEVCIGGYHLFNPATKKTVPTPLLEEIAGELARHDTRYYTCHCTGAAAYRYLSDRIPTMSYLSCGDSIEF